jgi:hypothetical protein
LKKTLAFVMLAGLMLTGCSKPASAEPAAPTSTAAAAASIAVPNVVGLALDKATDQLKDLGLKAEAKDIDAGKTIVLKSNWVVATQDPADSTQVAKGSTVNLGVKPIAKATPTPTPTPTKAVEVVAPAAPAEVVAPVAPPAYVPPAPPAYVPHAAPAAPPAGGTIICKDGYAWPSATRQGACSGHGGIRK